MDATGQPNCLIQVLTLLYAFQSYKMCTTINTDHRSIRTQVNFILLLYIMQKPYFIMSTGSVIVSNGSDAMENLLFQKILPLNEPISVVLSLNASQMFQEVFQLLIMLCTEL